MSYKRFPWFSHYLLHCVLSLSVYNMFVRADERMCERTYVQTFRNWFPFSTFSLPQPNVMKPIKIITTITDQRIVMAYLCNVLRMHAGRYLWWCQCRTSLYNVPISNLLQQIVLKLFYNHYNNTRNKFEFRWRSFITLYAIGGIICVPDWHIPHLFTKCRFDCSLN